MSSEEPLIDPSLLADLTPEQQAEALAAAAAARRAEERAEQRALERALAKKAAERQRFESSTALSATTAALATSTSGPNAAPTAQVKYISKRQRQQPQSQPPPLNNGPLSSHSTLPSGIPTAPVTAAPMDSSTTTTTSSASVPAFKEPNNYNNNSDNNKVLSDKERQAIRQTYLGKTTTDPTQQPQAKKQKKEVKSKKATFRFEWDNTDDTLDPQDPLYAEAAPVVKPLNHHDPLVLLDRDGSGSGAHNNTTNTNHTHSHKKGIASSFASSYASSVLTKPLDRMTARDWRIFRENYEIVVKGGKAPPPLRNFREAKLHPSLLNAIENVLQYKEPTPIQRQAIPIGLQRRDLIGIAETGSGKTAAFGVPLLQYLFQLSPTITSRVAEDGPLALVLAPTRELALQIHGEFQKLLSRQSTIRAAAVVGGQSIQHQAQELRDGVHVVVGTPGRINDCIEMAYMVLNQCCYIVLDEADRMIDMGFAPQMESILDAMGGLLKSEVEEEAYRQEELDRQAQEGQGALPRHRLTAMFSATMPLEVERMAKRYLRHPAVISIGDQDSSKNHRIVQKILFLSNPSQKEKALRDLILDPRFLREKVIVFVNEKKHADGVGRMIERFGRPCVVLHGGKSQEQREDNLAKFRAGGVVLVATDVAGRGLDIPNVAHVINYDLPTRSIDSYNHRIGRTGRAGKQGLATSLLTDEDEGIMAPLKQYLESTGQPIPDKLARHPAANANTAQGNLIY